MSERLRVAILSGCLFVIGLHLEQSGRLLLEVWRGPYATADRAQARTAQLADPGARVAFEAPDRLHDASSFVARAGGANRR